ncbi:hypothetical protein BDB00DRAFT_893438 [Zychaea mexicana]|uniref:uncharacterized protein n=1 Tax=Zychaea mexicana TaxID=64656 RepID=UPI0022FEAF34|nr:uncharacterized protein BDB00DRAFT_893438 [Zychaea mexicana]KAI9496207.1 hypothetical protein BDB00DRAFT_893438 [Zychaea mexicana]
MGFPAWAIICVVAAVVAILLTGLALFLIKRKRRSSSPTVDIIQDEKMNYQQQQQQQEAHGGQTSNATTVRSHKQPSPPMTPHHAPPSPQNHHRHQQEQQEEEETEGPPTPKPRKMSRTERKQHQDNVKINLPLPPPSTSLFSDKMELSSEEAMELFDKYMNIDSKEAEKPGFYSSMQRKAGTIRSTVRQSLRREKSNKSSTPLNQLFTADQQQQQQQQQSYHYQPPPTPSSATSAEARSIAASASPLPSLPQTPVHTKTPSPTATPAGKQRQEEEEQQQQLDFNDVDEVTIPPVVEEAAAAAYNDGKNNNASMRAARRVIRTASRKSKTRSMLVNEEDVMKMFGPTGEHHQRDNSHSFATVREKPTTGSVRRLVRDSIVTDKSATVSAVRATNSNGATSVRQIAEWWSPEDSKPAKIAGNSANNSNATSNFGNIRNGNTGGNDNSRTLPPPPRKPGKLVDDQQKGNVDTIRRMLQASMAESGSMASISKVAGRSSNEATPMGPDPVASFSSSTVRTMIPENDQQSFGAAGMAAQEKIEIDDTNFALLQQNGHQTWNGRANRVSNRPSVLPQQQQLQQSGEAAAATTKAENKSFFNTVNVGRRQSARRKVMPWMDSDNDGSNSKRTPAQCERDQYLQSLYDNA